MRIRDMAVVVALVPMMVGGAIAAASAVAPGSASASAQPTGIFVQQGGEGAAPAARAQAEGMGATKVSESDTFGRRLAKLAQLKDAEDDAKIRALQVQTGTAPSNAMPLPGAQQAVGDNEPVLESVWGLKGKEVVEARYKGRPVPLSMQEPDIPNGDGWRLAEIRQYEVKFVRMKAGRAVQHKTVTIDWARADATQTAVAPTNSQVITPSIAAPVLR